MSPARKAFSWVFGVALVIGILVGIGELVAPDAVSVTLNGRDVTGFAGLVTSTAIGAAVGLILALIVAGIVKLATRGMTTSV
jgi:hypothetical protein